MASECSSNETVLDPPADELTKIDAEAGGSAEQASSSEPNSEIVQQVSEGFLNLVLPQAKSADSKIKELTHSQTVLIEAIQHENNKFAECKEFEQLTEMMTEAKHYHTKLLNLKKEMKSIQEKSTKLKRRALELQQQKQKKMLLLEQQREREMERERQLTAKPAKPGAL